MTTKKETFLDDSIDVLNYKDISFDDILAYCKAHEATDWLKEEMARTIPQKVYPRVKTPKLGLDGKPLTKQKVDKKTGKVKEVLVYETKVDKTQPYVLKEQKITFVQVKEDFVDKFMPEIRPTKKAKKKTMFDIVAEL